MKKIAVLGANEPIECFYRQAKKLGYYIIGIAYENGAICKKYCDKFYPISFTDKDSVLDICKKECIDGITSFSLESALPTLIYVAKTMGLVSNSFECLNRLSNKYSMRRYLQEGGILNPQYKVISCVEDLAYVAIPFPCIVKPIDSGGSQGVTKVNFKEELTSSFLRALEYSRVGEVIIEQFIDGREFSVEYLSYKGKHYNLQITDKVTSGDPYFIELQHHQPAIIDSSIRDQIKCLTEKALSILKVENSPSHTEMKLNTDNKLYIIEIGARLGGDYITSDLVRLSTGYDMVKGALELATGDFSEPTFLKVHNSGVYFYSLLSPEIRYYIDNASEYNDIVKSFRYKETHSHCQRNGDRDGYFIYQSDHKFIIT